GLIVLALVELDLAAPAARGDAEAGDWRVLTARDREADGKADVAGPESLGAQTHGGFVEQLVRHGPGFFRGAHLRREHVGVADGLLMFELRHLEVLAAQPVPKPLSPHRSPDFAGLLAIEREQLVHGVKAFFVEPLLRARANAGKIAERELAERFGKNVEGEGH